MNVVGQTYTDQEMTITSKHLFGKDELSKDSNQWPTVDSESSSKSTQGDKPVEEPVDELVYEPVDDRVNKPKDKTVDEPVNEPINEPVNKLVNEPINEPDDIIQTRMDRRNMVRKLG